MTQSLLIYDGRNVLFRAVVEAATSQSDDIVPVRWDAEPVQAFLDSQFDARPFAFILVEGDAVYVGAETVGRILDRTGVADSLVEGLKRTYAIAGPPVGRVIHGRAIADLDGTFPLSDAAAAHLADLRREHGIPVRENDADGR